MTRKTILRLCAALAAVLSFSGNAAAQQTYDVDLTIASATVKSFTDALTVQTGIVFSFESAVASKPLGNVSVVEKKATAAAILDKVLSPKGISYSQVGNTFILSVAQKQAKSAGLVKGTVIDASGAPLPGVGVVIRGTTTGVITDAGGAWQLAVAKGQSLEFSSLGFETQIIPVGDAAVINVTLKEDSKLLEEVVVVGYGTQSRKTLTTAVSKVDGDKLASAPVSSVGDALKGKVTGLRVSTSNSLAGESPRFMIRGGSSVTLDNDPIYVVDGALYPDLTGINPNDIESMTVLKDAASAAIYGARASNGVILVTTRKGTPSKGPQITFDLQIGVNQPERTWDLLNSREQISLVRPSIARIYANSTGTLAASAWLTGANVAVGTGNTSEKNFFTTQYLDYGGTVPDGYQWMADPVDPTKVIIFTDRDNQSEWLRTVLYQKEYIGINGGNDKVRYAASIGHTKDDGVVAMSGYQNLTVHGSTSFKILKNLEATTTFDVSRQKQDKFTDNYFNAYGRGIMLAPTIRAYNSNGDWVQGAANANHEIASYYDSFYEREACTNRSSALISLKWTIIDGLDLVGQYNFFDNNYRGSYYARGSYNGHPAIISTTRSTTETRTETLRDTFSAYLNFNRSFGGAKEHTVSAMAGTEYINNRYWYVTANSTGSASDDIPMLQSGTNFTASNKDESWSMLSFYGRAQYDYKSKYIASFTARYDGSSKFAKGNQWGFFPSGSIAWVLSEEPFFDNARSTMNNLKIRASYGLTGNNGIGLYDALGAFSTDSYNSKTTYLPSDMANTGLKWETTSQLDLGVDLGFCRDRYRVVFDFYNKVTSNMLFNITLPDTGPYSSVIANVGSARFWGYELELGADIIQKKNFNWAMDFTYSFTRNKVLSLPENYAYEEVDQFGNPTGKTAYRIGGYKMTETGYRFGGTAVGEPLGRIYGYKIDHIIQSEADADAALYDASGKGHRVSDGASSTGRKDVGDYAWVNRYGSAKKDGAEIINAEDMFYLGNVVPHSTGGFNNTFRFYGVTVGIYFDYAFGHSIYNYMKSRMLQNTIASSNSSIGRYVYDCWQYPGDTKAKYARYFPNDGDYGNANWGRQSDFNTEDASYVCLRDVSISYDLPEKWLKNIHIKKLTVGVSGNTLHYFTKVTGAINPETGIGAGSGASMYSSVSTADGSGNIFPANRKFLFNLKLTF